MQHVRIVSHTDANLYKTETFGADVKHAIEGRGELYFVRQNKLGDLLRRVFGDACFGFLQCGEIMVLFVV